MTCQLFHLGGLHSGSALLGRFLRFDQFNGIDDQADGAAYGDNNAEDLPRPTDVIFSQVVFDVQALCWQAGVRNAQKKQQEPSDECCENSPRYPDKAPGTNPD